MFMRVAKQAETALERQVWESVHIYSLVVEAPTTYLNLKSEWGHSKNSSWRQEPWPHGSQKSPHAREGRKRKRKETLTAGIMRPTIT